MAEKNREEASQFREEDKVFLAALNEQVGKINEALDGLDQAARDAIQLYLDSGDIESRRRAFATIKQLFNGDVGLGGHAPADWIRNDFRIWLSQLGFNFAVSNGVMGICGVPDDRTLAWRLTEPVRCKPFISMRGKAY